MRQDVSFPFDHSTRLTAPRWRAKKSKAMTGTSTQTACPREPGTKVKAGAEGLPNMAPEPRDEKRAAGSADTATRVLLSSPIAGRSIGRRARPWIVTGARYSAGACGSPRPRISLHGYLLAAVPLEVGAARPRRSWVVPRDDILSPHVKASAFRTGREAFCYRGVLCSTWKSSILPQP